MSNSAYRIFKAGIEHARLLADFSSRTFREAFELMTDPRDLEAYIATYYTPEEMIKELAERRSAVFVAEIENLWVGYAQLKAAIPPECVTGSNPLQLYRLYVARMHHGKGLGQMLMKKCYHFAEDKGYKTLWLSTWTKNTRAVDVYRKQGFETVGEQIFWVGSDPQQDLIMARNISASQVQIC